MRFPYFSSQFGCSWCRGPLWFSGARGFGFEGSGRVAFAVDVTEVLVDFIERQRDPALLREVLNLESVGRMRRG
jgi:hypothetical protein